MVWVWECGGGGGGKGKQSLKRCEVMACGRGGRGGERLTLGHVEAHAWVRGVWELVTVKGAAEAEPGVDELLAGGGHSWEEKCAYMHTRILRDSTFATVIVSSQ